MFGCRDLPGQALSCGPEQTSEAAFAGTFAGRVLQDEDGALSFTYDPTPSSAPTVAAACPHPLHSAKPHRTKATRGRYDSLLVAKTQQPFVGRALLVGHEHAAIRLAGNLVYQRLHGNEVDVLLGA